MNYIELYWNVWQYLQAQRQKLPRAILLNASPGMGAFAFADGWVSSLLCENLPENGRSCGHCAACRWHYLHPDCRYLIPPALAPQLIAVTEDTESATGSASTASGEAKKLSQDILIDQVRALDHFLSVGAQRQGLRIIVIYPAERMNRNAANALLKLLEEAADNVLFLLVSCDAARLLPTVKSRCIKVDLPLPTHERALAMLSAAQVKSPDQWLALSGGAPEEALRLSEFGHSDWMVDLMGLLTLQHTPMTAIASLHKKLKTDTEKPLPQIIGWWQKWAFDLNLTKAGCPVRYFVHEQSALLRLSGRSTLKKILSFSRLLQQQRLSAEHPLNSRLYLESLATAYVAIFD